ncbi:MAG: TlpA disulfide reductase family protein [Solirubrobacterales bacterium]
MRSRRKLMLGIVLAGAALALAACGSSGDGDSGDSAGAVSTTADAAPPAKEKGVPKALAANRAEAGQILDEGSLDAKIAELEGHPIVVNQWASWCEPCRAEFPYFGDSANQHAGEVAFVGIDMQDDRGAAEDFLQQLPVPYPHVDDPSASQIASLGGGVVSPTTVFIDAQGEVVSVFQGAYASRDQLEQDIERYLLN